LPYHESDHVLNIAYNLLAGGHCLEDIELLRNDEAWLNALDAEIIPDPICDTFKRVRLRGDTDFSLTGNFDKWDQRCMFVFGDDCSEKND
jgi:hypothetical protein